MQVRPHRRELVGPFVERIRALPESRTVFHLTGPDDYLVHVAVADMADLQRLVLDEFTSRREVARVETRLIFQQWDCGPLLPVVQLCPQFIRPRPQFGPLRLEPSGQLVPLPRRLLK